ncbi:hypothetical protein SDRG_16303 [Saprolegnia diclina VS20]|uniref:Uncharacterized protein n=1 Tax=Saprolegnia diclina (strain VS20) TaxID=1156394 RepID=T0PKE4_SAPDV|nr:hypothetical protein SDRG_16303 [Saprolegnia diclina VS20]EQC25854.1 hypothetical protein SDRG_16303 [Saprolegnia diclina VS20]|eukprot:XP_008620729.1 hypothetical protein SDRG_16303 [Saprolegnia diclina VS20]
MSTQVAQVAKVAKSSQPMDTVMTVEAVVINIAQFIHDVAGVLTLLEAVPLTPLLSSLQRLMERLEMRTEAPSCWPHLSVLGLKHKDRAAALAAMPAIASVRAEDVFFRNFERCDVPCSAAFLDFLCATADKWPAKLSRVGLSMPTSDDNVARVCRALRRCDHLGSIQVNAVDQCHTSVLEAAHHIRCLEWVYDGYSSVVARALMWSAAITAWLIAGPTTHIGFHRLDFTSYSSAGPLWSLHDDDLAFAKALATVPSLTLQGADSIADMLVGLHTPLHALTQLSINAEDVARVEGLFGLVDLAKITHLDITLRGRQQDLLSCFGAALPQLTSLQELRLDGMALAEATTTSLRVVCIDNVECSELVARRLLQWISSSPCLNEVSWYGLEYADILYTELATNLRSWIDVGVHRVGLTRAGLDDAGATEMAQVLRDTHHASGLMLDFRFNDFLDVDGARELINALGTCSNVTLALDLSDTTPVETFAELFASHNLTWRIKYDEQNMCDFLSVSSQTTQRRAT